MPASDDFHNPPRPPDTDVVLFNSPNRSEVEPHPPAKHRPYNSVDMDAEPAPREPSDPPLAPAELTDARVMSLQDASLEDALKPARPAYVLYSPGCVAWAAFWGGFLGGALVLARNYWVLRRRGAAVAVVLTLAALTLTASVALPGLRWFIALPAVVGSWLGASLLQGRLYRRHKRACGRSGSGSAAFGIGLLGGVVSVGLAVGLFGSVPFQAPLPGTCLRVGHDDAIYYSRGATRAEAERLGKFLKSEGFFDESTRQDVLLSNGDQAVLVSFFVESGAGTSAATVRSFEMTAPVLSGEVFDGRPVQVLLRDARGRIQRRLPPRTGVSRRAWQRHNDAATADFEAGRFAEAEAHYRAAVTAAEQHESLQMQLVWSLNNVGQSRLNQGLTEDVEPHFQRALSIATPLMGADCYEAAYALTGLAKWEFARGNLGDAEARFRRALTMWETLGPAEEENRLSTLTSLVKVLIAAQRFAPAAEFQRQVVAAQEREMLGIPAADQATHLHWLGWLQLQLGQYAEARSTLEQALDCFEEAELGSSDDALSCHLQVGVLCRACGEYATAESTLRSALDRVDVASDAGRLRQAEFQEALGDVLVDQARYEAAEQLQRKALALREQVLGANDAVVADSLRRLGAIATQLGRFPEAESLLQRAIAIFDKSAEDKPCERADCEFDLALLCHAQGRYADAQPLYQAALAVFEQHLGAEHDRVGATLSALSELYSDRGDFTAAEPLARRAHELVERQLGADHPLLVRTFLRVALVLRGQHRLAEAEQTLRRSLEIGTRSLGAQHPYLADTQNVLAIVLLERDRTADAESLLEQAIRSFEAVLGPDHPSLIGPHNNLGLVYQRAGQAAAAAEQFERALQLAESVFSADDPCLLPVLTNYANALRLLGRVDEAAGVQRRADAIRTKQIPQVPQPAESFVT